MNKEKLKWKFERWKNRIKVRPDWPNNSISLSDICDLVWYLLSDEEESSKSVYEEWDYISWEYEQVYKWVDYDTLEPDKETKWCCLWIYKFVKKVDWHKEEKYNWYWIVIPSYWWISIISCDLCSHWDWSVYKHWWSHKEIVHISREELKKWIKEWALS